MATNSIVAGPTYTVLSNANITFHVTNVTGAGIDLKAGFSASSVGGTGQIFRGYIGGAAEASPSIVTPDAIHDTRIRTIKEGALSEREKPPMEYFLSANYPNPFNPVTMVEYGLPKESRVLLKLYDAVGREVKTLIDRVESPGLKSVGIDGTNLPSGMYFLRLRAGEFMGTTRLLLVR